MPVLSPVEAESRFLKLGLPFRFSEAEKLALETTKPVTYGSDVFGFPTPKANSGINLLMLRHLLGVTPSAGLACLFDHPWYLDEPFAVQDCVPGWHYVEMQVGPQSLSQPCYYLGSLMEGAQLPQAVEVALMVFMHFAGTGEQLLHKKHTWCSDRASLGRNVTAGAFGRNGLFISAHQPAFTSRGLGICARLPNLPHGSAHSPAIE